MKTLIYLIALLFMPIIFLRGISSKPALAATAWTFDPTYPTCGTWTYNPTSGNGVKGSLVTVTVRATTVSPSLMSTIYNFTSPTDPGGTIVSPPSSGSCTGAGTTSMSCPFQFTNSGGLIPNTVSFTARAENRAGNGTTCSSTYTYMSTSSWLKTTGGDVHANQ